MSRRKPAPDLIRGGRRFADKDMRQRVNPYPWGSGNARFMPAAGTDVQRMFLRDEFPESLPRSHNETSRQSIFRKSGHRFSVENATKHRI